MAHPLVIGHAAAAGEAPANTLAGVRACLNAGADAMEIDVQLSADGVPVLMHDETVDRTTNLSGPVRGLTLSQLQAADAGDGEPVPTLEEVLTLVDGRLTVMCELKSTPRDSLHDQRCVDAVVACIENGAAHSWTAVHSFRRDMVSRSRAADPRISAAIITDPVEGNALELLLGGLLKRNGQAISVAHEAVTPKLVRRARQRQVTVWAWTADQPDDWARLIEAGADGIITNVPNALRAYLDTRG